MLGNGLLALSLAVTAGAEPNSPPSYTITDLGTLGGSGSSAVAINNRGQVVGQAGVPGGNRAFLWDSTGMRDLGDLGWPASAASAINDLGQVVGNSNTTGNAENHAFFWDLAGIQDLGTLGGGEGHPWDINDAGDIVGSASVADGGGDLSRYHPFLFRGGVMRDLGRPPSLDLITDGNTFGEALAVNAAGQVLVRFSRYVSAVPPQSRHYLWQEGVWQHLNFLDNRLVTQFGGAGEIIGSTSYSHEDVAPGHAFVYDGARFQDLGTLGGPLSIALSMNGRGQVVGYSQVDGPPPVHPVLFGLGVMDRPFLYSGGVMHDLTNLLLTSAPWERFVPHGINDHGQIAGTGYWFDRGIQTRAYLLTPHPTAPVALPAAPSGLSVRSASTSKLDLGWTDSSGNEQSFVIERRLITGDWATIGTVLPNTTAFADTTVVAYTRYLYRVRATNGAGSSAWSNEAAGDAGIGAVARLSGTALDFGSVSLDSSSNLVSLTLANRGTGPLDLQSVTLGGSHPGDFSVVESPTRIAPGDTAALRLRFTPTALGSRSAQLILSSNATHTIEPVGLTGSGTPSLVPAVAFTPSSLSFGQEPMGLHGTLAVLLHNTGQVPVNIGSIAIQGPHAGEFSLPMGGCSNSTLAPGALCLLNVRFSPAATGSRTATLVIPTNAAGSPHLVPLSGTGTAPLLRLNADILRFIIPSAGQTTVAQTLTFTNHGDAPLAIEGLVLVGPHAASFQIVGDSGEESLDPGATRTVKVAFRPAQIVSTGRRARIAGARIASVSYNAVLEIRHNDLRPGSPQQIALTAAATAPSAPTGLRAVGNAAAPHRVELTWGDMSPNETEFVLLRRTSAGVYIRVAVLPANRTSYVDTTASPNTSYRYIMRAVNGIGVSAWSNEASVTTPVIPMPAAPTPLRATAVSATRVELSWTDRNSSETQFVLLRKTGSGLYVRIAVLGPDTTSYADTTARPNRSYSYIMRVVNAVGVSPWTNEPSVTTPSGLPAKPTNLRAVAVSSTRVNLTWTDTSSNEQQFVLLRKVGAGLYRRIGVVGANTTSFADTTVSGGTRYTYIMRAVNEFGVSAWTNEPSVTTP